MSQPKCDVPGMPSTLRQQLTSQITAAVAEEKSDPVSGHVDWIPQFHTSCKNIRHWNSDRNLKQDVILIEVNCTFETKYLYKRSIF